jgi:cation:H+ antiporter
VNPFADLPLWAALAAFVAAAMVITMAGIRMAETADRLADRTGIGEALFGGLLLGGSTSIPGIVASTTAAAQGHAELAFSNAVGGIAAQTFFLAIADIAYRRANLEHAAASLTNLTQASLLITLLILPLIAVSLPTYTVFEIHPVTIAILIGYLFGLRLALRSRTMPMWGPKKTSDTRLDVPHEPKGGRRIMMALLLRFAVLAAILMLTGYVTATSGVAIADKTGMSESIIGAYFTAISTSIPELVTTIAAVRRGALTLAMGGIVGGNMFDTLFIASSDIAYRDGSLYHAVSGTPYFLTALSILMTGVLLLGMLRRERHGIANIGFESALIFVIYLGGTAILITAG